MATRLDFEEPIAELEQKIEELQSFSRSHDVDVSHGTRLLEERLARTKEKVFRNLTPWQRVQLARHPDRPLPIDYVERLCTDFLELHGDRRFADDPAIFGGFARLDEDPVMVIGTRKGRDVKGNVAVNFGCAHPEGYRKALRLMQLAAKAKVPILVFIDTPGAYPGIGAEERHIGEAIAVNLQSMFALQVPIVAVVTGEGGSGGALGIAVANRILILEHAYYSVITPEGCAAILWHGEADAARAAEALKLTSADLKRMEIVDAVVPEPIGGAQRDLEGMATALRAALREQLDALGSVPGAGLCRQRYEKYRSMGVFLQE